MLSDLAGPYGEWIFELGLAESIERGILAGFEIDVLEVRDPDPVLGLSEEALRGRRLALLQAALLEHATRHNLKTVMTFHQRVEEAAAFATRLPETAAELYAAEASDAAIANAERLPASTIDAEFYELEPGRHVPPDRVWSAWLCGDHLVSERRETLKQFANGVDADGRMGPPRLPRKRSRPRRRRRHRGRAGRGGRVLRRHPRLAGGDRAEHRPRAPPEPGRHHQGRAHHRAGLPSAGRGPEGHGRLRLVRAPCGRAPRPTQSLGAHGRPARVAGAVAPAAGQAAPPGPRRGRADRPGRQRSRKRGTGTQGRD